MIAIYNLLFTDKTEAQRGEVSYAKLHTPRAGAHHLNGLNSTCTLSVDFTTIYLTVTLTLLMPTLPLHSFPHPAAKPLTSPSQRLPLPYQDQVLLCGMIYKLSAIEISNRQLVVREVRKVGDRYLDGPTQDTVLLFLSSST